MSMNPDQLDAMSFVLYHEAYDKYPFKDLRWQNNYLARARRLARKLDPKSKKMSQIERIAVMRLDIAQTRVGRKIWPGY